MTRNLWLLLCMLISVCASVFCYRRTLFAKGSAVLKALICVLAVYLGYLVFHFTCPGDFYRRFLFSVEFFRLMPTKLTTMIKSAALMLPLGFFISAPSRGKHILKSILCSAAAALLLELPHFFFSREITVLGYLCCVISASVGVFAARLLPVIKDDGKKRLSPFMYALIVVIISLAAATGINYALTTPKTEKSVAVLSDGTSAYVSIEARNAYATDLDTNEVIFSKASKAAVMPASTIKLLTALTALDYFSLDDVVTIGNEVKLPPPDASVAGLSSGMTLTIGQLTDALILPSGADAAYALAVAAGRRIGGNDLGAKAAITSFVAAANKKAVSLGATHTRMADPCGYDHKGQVTTAEDIAKIAAAFVSVPELRSKCAAYKLTDTLRRGGRLTFTNTNLMLDPYSAYYDERVSGVKTGTTDGAGNCLVALATVDGRRILTVVMGSSYDGKYTDTKALLTLAQKDFVLEQ